MPRTSIARSKNMSIFNLNRYCWIALQNSCTRSHSDCRSGILRVSLWVQDAVHHLSKHPLQAISDSVYRSGGSCPECLLRLVSCNSALAWLSNRVLEKAFQNGEVAWLTSCPAQSPAFPEKAPVDGQGLANSWLIGAAASGLAQRSAKSRGVQRTSPAPSPLPDKGPPPNALNNALCSSWLGQMDGCILPSTCLLFLLCLPCVS